MILSHRRFLISAAILTLPAAPAFAQKDAAAEQRSSGLSDDFHNDDMIVVTAPYVEQLDILAGTSVLSGDQLAEDLRGQIGDSLTGLPGVSSTSFAPGSPSGAGADRRHRLAGRIQHLGRSCGDH